MEEKKLKLVHQQDTYKMIIPQEVEKKIRLLCREICDVEWSGILFYKVNGSFEDKSLTITCIDVLQMDEGNSVYTEYSMSPDVCNYICNHPELMEAGIYQGLIHSHNHMTTFFSGTDTSTLLAEGSDMNHFVSLIVNNAGKYTAGITRRVKSKQAINEELVYPTWGSNEVKGNRTFIVEEEYVQWFNLNIEIEGINSNFEEEMLARIKEIRAIKSNKTSKKYFMNDYSINIEKAEHKKEITQPSLFSEDIAVDYENYQIDEKLVDWVVNQTITCSLIIPQNSDFDTEKWAKSMDRLYSKRFANEEEFEVFASNFVDYLICYTEDSKVSDYIDKVETEAKLACQVRDKLSKLPKNKWLDIWMKIYDDYII